MGRPDTQAHTDRQTGRAETKRTPEKLLKNIYISGFNKTLNDVTGLGGKVGGKSYLLTF